MTPTSSLLLVSTRTGTQAHMRTLTYPQKHICLDTPITHTPTHTPHTARTCTTPICPQKHIPPKTTHAHMGGFIHKYTPHTYTLTPKHSSLSTPDTRHISKLHPHTHPHTHMLIYPHPHSPTRTSTPTHSHIFTHIHAPIHMLTHKYVSI